VIAAVLLAAACGGVDDATSARTQEPVATTPAPTIEKGTVMLLSSTEFGDGEPIPSRFSCDGEDISPPLTITDIPAGAAALALIMDDPDAPGGTWDHWVAFDIAPTAEIAQDVGSLGISGLNSWGRTSYGGPCPPAGTHRYVFRVLALSEVLGLDQGADKATVLDAAAPLTLAEATLTGRYGR
jgi:hypothetical protein